MGKRGRPRKIKEDALELDEQDKDEGGEESEDEGQGGLVLGNGEYRFATNKYNVILQILTKNGSYRNWKYFSNPHNALEYVLEHELLKTGFKDIKTICDKIDEVKKMIQAIPDNELPQLRGK